MNNSNEKSEETTKPNPAGVEHTQYRVEIPEVLDLVEYAYANHARLSANKWDIRIAFGDIGPTGKLSPAIGVVLPHLTAKKLLEALGRMVEAAEAKLGHPIEDPDDGGEVQSDVNA